MTSGRIHLRRGLSSLELALWIAGCCALGYCGVVLIHASRAQATLVRSFEQSRIRPMPRTMLPWTFQPGPRTGVPAGLEAGSWPILRFPGLVFQPWFLKVSVPEPCVSALGTFRARPGRAAQEMWSSRATVTLFSGRSVI